MIRSRELRKLVHIKKKQALQMTSQKRIRDTRLSKEQGAVKTHKPGISSNRSLRAFNNNLIAGSCHNLIISSRSAFRTLVGSCGSSQSIAPALSLSLDDHFQNILLNASFQAELVLTDTFFLRVLIIEAVDTDGPGSTPFPLEGPGMGCVASISLLVPGGVRRRKRFCSTWSRGRSRRRSCRCSAVTGG